MKIKTVTVVFFAALIASTAPAFADIEDVLIGAWQGMGVDRPVRHEFIIERGAGAQRRRIIFCVRHTPDARSLAIGIIDDASQTITVVKGPKPREEVRNALDLTWGRWDSSELGVFYRPFNGRRSGTGLAGSAPPTGHGVERRCCPWASRTASGTSIWTPTRRRPLRLHRLDRATRRSHSSGLGAAAGPA